MGQKRHRWRDGREWEKIIWRHHIRRGWAAWALSLSCKGHRGGGRGKAWKGLLATGKGLRRVTRNESIGYHTQVMVRKTGSNFEENRAIEGDGDPEVADFRAPSSNPKALGGTCRHRFPISVYIRNSLAAAGDRSLALAAHLRARASSCFVFVYTTSKCSTASMRHS